MNKNALISLITVNYNGLKDTSELIESLQNHITYPYELIVVDNGSIVDEAAVLQEKYAHIICIRSDKNLGFSGGNNLGIKKATGNYLFFINNDTVVEDDSIKLLADFLESNPKIGGVSPMIKYADSSNIIQYAGATPLSQISLRNQTIGLGEMDNGQHNVPSETSFLHGAAMMIRKGVVDKVGHMPEIFFLYYEEIDWSSKIIDAGYELWYNPQCTIYHKESRSVGRESPLKVFYMTRNRLLYASRNRKGIKKYLSYSYLFFIASGRSFLMSIIKRRFDLTKALCKGNIAFLKLESKQN